MIQIYKLNTKQVIFMKCMWCLDSVYNMFISKIAGSPITPNYVDNSTSNVSPWCSCSASSNLKNQCVEFLEYFTENICLSESILFLYIICLVTIWSACVVWQTKTFSCNIRLCSKPRWAAPFCTVYGKILHLSCFLTKAVPYNDSITL